MPDRPPSPPHEADPTFVDRLERVLVQRLTAPTSSGSNEIQRAGTVSTIDNTPSWFREGDALNDLEPIIEARQPSRRRLVMTIAFWAAAAALLVVALAAVIRPDDRQDPADHPSIPDVPPPTLEVAPDPGPQPTPFEGNWVSTDTDGSTQMMEIGRSGNAFEVVVRDDSAGVCSGVPSSTTGAGALDADGALVLPQPLLTCNDGSIPAAASGPPLEEQLANLTFTHDATKGELTDNFGTIWRLRPRAITAPTPSGGRIVAPATP